MLPFVLRRVVVSVPVLLLATVATFFAVSAVGDPLGQLSVQPGISEETAQHVAERRHLDRPLVVQYGYWMQSVVTEGFGTTIFGRPIWPELRRAIWFTLQLVVVAEFLALALGVALGAISAKRQYSLFDYATTAVSFLGFAVPTFWFALVLQVLATQFFQATGVRLFYTAGLSSVDPGTGLAFLVDRVQHLVLPIVALAFTSTAFYSRYMRSSMLEVVGSDYVRTARAKGLREGAVTYRHALRNALIPVVTVAALNFATVFSGAILVETIFGIPGLGRFFYGALLDREAYSVMAFLMVTAVFIIVANLVADLLYGYLDPRIRHG